MIGQERIVAAREKLKADSIRLKDVSDRMCVGTLRPEDEAWLLEWENRQAGPEQILEGTVGPRTLCQVLDVHPKTLQNLRREGLPWLERGAYNIPACVQWFSKRAEMKGRRGGTRGEEEKRKLRAQSRKLELEGDRLAGKLISREFVERSISRAIVEARGTLENLPVQVAALVPGDLRNDVQERGREIVESALRSLAEGRVMPAPAVVEEDSHVNDEDGEDSGAI